jgi:hypothetical protein
MQVYFSVAGKQENNRGPLIVKKKEQVSIRERVGGKKGKRKSAPGLPDWSPTSVLPWLDAA